MTFTDLGISAPLTHHLVSSMNITSPTSIQEKAIKHLCTSHRDTFIQAQTGSGKTLAYLLPLIQNLATLARTIKETQGSFNRASGLFAVILTPTRELSTQISSVLDTLLHCYHYLVSGIVIGGERKKSEKARLRRGVNILVATPGRLLDHINNTQVLDISRVRWLVLDEGDRLMELGFERDISRIVGLMGLRATKKQDPIPGLPERRMTVLVSATMERDVERLSSLTLKGPAFLSSEGCEREEKEKPSVPAQLRQSYAIVPAKQRLVALAALLKQTFSQSVPKKVIVFFGCADSVAFYFSLLARTPPGSSNTNTSHAPSKFLNETEIFKLYGTLPQPVRSTTLEKFTSLPRGVLFSTDIASRGLDVPNVDLVVEFDPAFAYEDHIHRVGRTARAGRNGQAILFLMPGCEENYTSLLETSTTNLRRQSAEGLLSRGFGTNWEAAATEFQLECERWVLKGEERLELARRGFKSHVRAYATHVGPERGFFDLREMHLGHVAKGFALREAPGRIGGRRCRDTGERRDGRDASRGKSANGKNADAPRGTKRKGERRDEQDDGTVDVEAGRKRMLERAKAMMIDQKDGYNIA
ncbi:putative ATP-dependent RNA helicase dbp7 [Piedraia hortae CBS 480.64]|uniref:ATP-dependent RNA helicase n=1 Tax=Piedraia hortae CBS 480.64 TaxID=1314780 RepID=A0A6A7C2Q3_9PEZI|nr:putative ATP-dependent RNA helicase dbp7 [Piedraia hortae CBS 480.64]